MPNLLGSFSDTLAARAVAIAPGSVAYATALRSSGAALELAAANPATTENQWRAALAAWRARLATLTRAALRMSVR